MTHLKTHLTCSGLFSRLMWINKTMKKKHRRNSLIVFSCLFSFEYQSCWYVSLLTVNKSYPHEECWPYYVNSMKDWLFAGPIVAPNGVHCIHHVVSVKHLINMFKLTSWMSIFLLWLVCIEMSRIKMTNLFTLDGPFEKNKKLSLKTSYINRFGWMIRLVLDGWKTSEMIQ